MSQRAKHILFCNCSYADVVPAETKRTLLAALRAADAEAIVVADLCELAARKDPALNRLASGDALVIACFPRAVKGLLESAGIACENLEVLNMKIESAESIATKAGLNLNKRKDAPEPEKKGDWVPWFPVIDRGRCSNCKQCLNFCLFGVYEALADGTVRVVNPSACKTNCPACARICPEIAIIFPKHGEAPIDGAEIEDEQRERANVKINVEEILGSDIYAALAERRKKRTLLKTKSLSLAHEERARHTGDK